MSDTPATPPVPTPPPVAPPAEPAPPTTTPDPAPEPDKGTSGKDWQNEAEKWKALARKHEEAAKANADKAKAFDQVEESSKTELQKAQERAEAAEQKAAEIEARAQRAEVAAAKGVPSDLLTGSTKEQLEASADALLAFRGEQAKPDFGGGNRGEDVGAGKAQLTQEQVSKLYAERKYDEIEKARTEGRLDQILGAGHRP